MQRAKQISESIELGIILALAGGFMDVYSYIGRDHVFANAQTGNILLVGVSISEGNWALAGRYFFPVVSFAVGIMLADLVHERFGSVIHWRQVTVFFEAVILLGVSFIPGGNFNLLANCLTSFACGMQVESFRKIHGSGIATTMCGGDWHVAMSVIFLEGVVILLLVLCGLREAIMDAIPVVLRHAISVGLGMFIAMIGVSVPSFILGAVLQYFLGLQLRKTFGINLFPIQGWGKFNQTLLPSFALGLGSLATVSRLMRTSMLDVLGQDYIKTAKSKGLSQGKILWRHALRNAIMPVVTVMGPTVASVLTGTFVIESIFNIPGLGKYFVTSIKDLDYTMIGGTVVFYGGLLIVCTLVVDLLYGFIDPRVKLEG